MPAVAPAVILIYAAVLIVGGLIGWRLSGSRVSFTAGLASAALLTIAYRISRTSPPRGYLMAAVVSLALTVLFGLRFRRTKKVFPAGMMLFLSGFVVLIMGWSTVVSW